MTQPSRATATAVLLLLVATVAWPFLLWLSGSESWAVAGLTTFVVGAAGVVARSSAEHRGRQHVATAVRCAERDRQWLRRQLRRAQASAEHDPLTGVLNRRGLERVVVDLTGRVSASIGVLVIDVDDFKEVNDRLGHDAGDEVLRNLADRLGRCVRPTDALARTGGDEFVIVLPDAGPREVEAVARRIRDATATADELPALPGVSIGASGAPVRSGVAGPDAVAELVRRADRELYRAKAAKRGRVLRLGPEISDEQVC